MKILVFGRGVINTQYAWAFEKAGHTVEFYVRPESINKYNSVVHLEIFDGRKGERVLTDWSIKMRENVPNDHDFDFILISVNHNQLRSVVSWLSTHLSRATAFIYNNLFTEPLEEIADLPETQIVWGFPGGGGGFTEQNTLSGGFAKSIYMGFVDHRESTMQYQKVKKLFENAGFTVSEQKNLRDWLWFHFAINAATAAIALRDGSYDAVFDSTSNLKESMQILREMLPLIKAKGGGVNFGNRMMAGMPSGLMARVIKMAMKPGGVPREIMGKVTDSAHLNRKVTSIFPRDIQCEAHRLGIALPHLSAMEPWFRAEDTNEH